MLNDKLLFKKESYTLIKVLPYRRQKKFHDMSLLSMSHEMRSVKYVPDIKKKGWMRYNISPDVWLKSLHFTKSESNMK